MRRGNWLLLSAVLALLAGVLWSLAGWPQYTDTRPNVIILDAEGWRTDHLSCCGYSLPTTPSVDRLAAGGVVFQQNLAQSTDASFSRGSLLSSLYPAEISPLIPGSFPLPPDLPALPRILKMYDYTSAFFSGPGSTEEEARAYGFDTVTMIRGCDSFFHTVPAALKWLEQAPRPLLAFVRGADALHPRSTPALFSSLYDGADASYDGALTYGDAWIGTLVSRLGSLGLNASNTMIVVVSARGWDGDKGSDMSPRLLRVPLVMWGAGVAPEKRGTRVAVQTANVSLVPTVLEALGIVPPARARGPALSRYLRTPTSEAAPDDPSGGCVVAQGPTSAAAFLDGRYELVVRGVPAGSPRMVALLQKPNPPKDRFALYDLEAPSADGMVNLYSDPLHAARLAAMREGLLRAERESIAVKQSYRHSISPELRRSLEEHGYW